MRPEPGPTASAVIDVPPAWTDAEVATVLADRYGRTATEIARLGGEVDQNFAVTCADGTSVVVKVAPPDADLARIEWQHRLLAELSGGAELPSVPRLLAAQDGSELVIVGAHAVRVHTWLPGRTLAELGRHSSELLRSWGRAAAQLVRALPSDPPVGLRSTTHHWDVLRAPAAITRTLPAVHDLQRRGDVERICGWFEARVLPSLADLPLQVVHQDLNDFNILAERGPDGRHRLSGVLDFGDALHTARITELAVAVAYAMLRKADPLAAAAEIVRGYTALLPLTDAELRVLYPIAAARLCVNATTWTAREPGNGDYARARMQHTWPTIARLAQLPPILAEAWLRDAAGAPRPSVRLPIGTPQRVVTRHLEPAGEPVRRRTDTGVPATYRLGVDVADARLPFDGVVEHRDGCVLVVRHDGPLWTRWAPADVDAVPGSPLAQGTLIGTEVRVAAFTDRDTALLAPRENVPWDGVAAWRQVSPDPAPLFGHDIGPSDDADALALRNAHVASSQRSYYAEPPVLVGSDDVWLHDRYGLAYLDAINNVSSVGHANPAVVRALHEQAQRLNTNSRFVYDGFGRYAARLAALLPDALEVVFLVCSGSEANDLALRIARQVTGRDDIVVIDGAYHGNTAAVTAVSPNRYRGPGGSGRPATTHEVPQPNRYRGAYGYADPDAGARYAADAAELISGLDRPPAAFLAESLMGTAGTIVHPPGYLATVFDAVRAAGGLCISDEVQVGFGRLGPSFWGFATQAVVPDVVTLGKPIGNGHPLAAVVTTRAIADAFDTGMKYFNTFGGNPVSCAVGMAVLDEIESRDLPARAAAVGAHFRENLVALQRKHELIGDVRGLGLYLGVELVRDRATREPASTEARYVCERLKAEGVLCYPTGPHDNVLKIKPPLTFGREHADLFCAVLDDVLGSDW